MRRLLTVVGVLALLVGSTGIALASNGGSGGTAAGPHAFGHVLVGEYGGGPIGWVSFDVHRSTEARPGFGTFQFEALSGVANYPVTTSSIITAVDFYHEANCCGNPDVVIIWGTECQHFTGSDYYCRAFIAGFYDGGPGTRHDFFRWGDSAETMVEYWAGRGSLTVNLGT